MTQTGKCDTCRQRKVKVIIPVSHLPSHGQCAGYYFSIWSITDLRLTCSQCDEERPKCGSCKKKDRPCCYSYGKASAFVVQDPNQMTKHGKSKDIPIVYFLDGSTSLSATENPSSSNLRITTERAADSGHGFFQTLAPASRTKIGTSKKKSAHQKRSLEAYLQHLTCESTLHSIRPLSPETTLGARYIAMLGPQTSEKQPLSILGTWISSIPSRIGTDQMLDLAVEFFIDSYAVFWDETHSKRKLAQASKAKALRQLQLVVQRSAGKATYELLLATKMHYAAEVAHVAQSFSLVSAN